MNYKFTLQELEDKIEEYFAEMLCPGNEENSKPLTMSGLARRIGMSTGTLIRYTQYEDEEEVDYERKERRRIIAEARHRIEEFAEGKLYTRGSAAGAQFALKNFGGHWNEKSAVEHSMGDNVWELIREKRDVNFQQTGGDGEIR